MSREIAEWRQGCSPVCRKIRDYNCSAGHVHRLSAGNPSAFLTWRNTSNILTEASLTAVIAGGLTFPLLVGEFDMSVGYNASLSCVLVAGLMSQQHLPIVVAILLVILSWRRCRLD